jgi:hypothetical protein
MDVTSVANGVHTGGGFRCLTTVIRALARPPIHASSRNSIAIRLGDRS